MTARGRKESDVELVPPHGAEALRPRLLPETELAEEARRARHLKTVPLSTREVSDWFMGSDRTSTVVIVGGRDPEVISSADWAPAVGDEYAIVATQTVEGALKTDLCQQRLVTPELLTTLRDTYDDPQSPLTLPVELANATNARVTIDIHDASGMLVGASSGAPGGGATAAPHELIVENEASTRLRLTWVGGPCDSEDSLTIDETGRGFLLVQPECAGDVVVHDRVLILDFAEPIAASDVEAFLQDGLKTSS